MSNQADVTELAPAKILSNKIEWFFHVQCPCEEKKYPGKVETETTSFG